MGAVTVHDNCTATFAYAMQIEQSKLLSTAENLGLLATLESLLVTDPGKVTALSIPFFIAAAGEFVRFYRQGCDLGRQQQRVLPVWG